jgi:serine/threonine kinase 16
MSQYFSDFFSVFTNCFACFPSSPHITINNRRFKLQRLLGEGGFSYVYLVQDLANLTSLYALKKIRCPFGEESVALAMKEVDAYDLFAHANIIKAIDHSVESDRSDPQAKTVYILLPYYRRGNLQDVINANLVNQTAFPEKELLTLFLGVCRALKAMHQYKVSGAGTTGGRARGNEAPSRRKPMKMISEEEEDEEPLMEREMAQTQEGVGVGELRAYAHRDIKPGAYLI